MRFSPFAVRPRFASEILTAAIESTAGRCFGEELTTRRRSGQGVLASVFRGRDADAAEGWGPGWQRAHLAVVHTGTRSLVTCVQEVDASARLLDALEAAVPTGMDGDAALRALDDEGLRLLTEAHFFSWCFVAKASPRRTLPLPALIVDPRDLVGSSELASKAKTDLTRAVGPWRVHAQASDGRVRPARGVVERATGDLAEPVTPVEVRGMVPTGGSPLVPGWGSAAVLSMTLLRLDGWRDAQSGAALVADWSWIGAGATNLRREDRWRHDVHEHADRVRLPSPFQVATLDCRWWTHDDDILGPAAGTAGPSRPTSWRPLGTWSART